MKYIIFIFILFLISCSPLATILPIQNELIITGGWTGYAIITELGVFKTSIGMKGLNVPVLLIYHDDKWYWWNNGYRDVIQDFCADSTSK